MSTSHMHLGPLISDVVEHYCFHIVICISFELNDNVLAQLLELDWCVTDV